MAGARIRRLTERDIDRAIALTDLEGWGYTRADFERLLSLSPEGCFAAEEAGHVVGLLTTTPYGRVAYLGAVIVSPERRGRRLGRTLLEKALDHLDSQGTETVVLNSYMHVITFYEGLGFRPDYENARWTGPPVASGASRARPARLNDLEAIAAFDRRYFGADRSALLRRLLQEFQQAFLVAESRGQIAGYVVGNASESTCEVGPWVVDPRFAAAGVDLLQGLLARVNATSVSFTAPTPNREPHRMAVEKGFQPAFRTLRMYRGSDPFRGQPEGIWGLAGLEKG